jgi:hypothetical protein
MKKYFLAFGLLAIFLIVFLPFASNNPDGLEKVAQDLGVEENTPIWKGLMFDYSVSAIAEPYFSTLTAGIVGTTIVLVLSIVLGKAVALKKSAYDAGQEKKG